jgi:hypothetical protein
MSDKEYREMGMTQAAAAAFRALVRGGVRSWWRASRLTTALEDFERALHGGAHAVYTVAVAADEMSEVCFVPPRYLLRDMPDAAALVRVDHVARTLVVMEVYDEYPPGSDREEDAWARIIEAASAAP